MADILDTTQNKTIRCRSYMWNVDVSGCDSRAKRAISLREFPTFQLGHGRQTIACISCVPVLFDVEINLSFSLAACDLLSICTFSSFSLLSGSRCARIIVK